MILSPHGKIVKNEIIKMPGYNQRVIIDEWIVMPNHIHLLIELTDCINCGIDDNNGNGGDTGWRNGGNNGGGNGGGNVKKIHEFSLPPIQPWWQNPGYKPTTDEIKQYRKQRRQMLIPKILGKFQMQTSKQINILNNIPGYKNWQANYHDHIVRNKESYQRIKQYIINNPKNWGEDKFNTADK